MFSKKQKDTICQTLFNDSQAMFSGKLVSVRMFIGSKQVDISSYLRGKELFFQDVGTIPDEIRLRVTDIH